MAASILPWLKSDGYHITFYSVPEAWEAIKHDPHIDRVILQNVDAIPNQDLGAFWAYTAKKYDRFINLSESIEHSLLAMPGNTNHGWSHAMRDKYLNHNYMQFIHDLAGVPMPPRVKFYATTEEKAWASAEYSRIHSGGPVVLWVLSGSAVHKVWPHMDVVIDRVLTGDDRYRFVLVGDAMCAKLEEGWEGTPHVIRRSGKWTIRQSLAFAQVADLVIGPETGVMNSISLEPVPKIVTLSHSSVENLTRDWVNCVSLTPGNTPCYPCHRINFGFTHCVESAPKSGLAACQVDISAGAMITAIGGLMKRRQEIAA